MYAVNVGAPPAGSLAIAKTTFSPLCPTGSGANGAGGRRVQKGPPQARAFDGSNASDDNPADPASAAIDARRAIGKPRAPINECPIFYFSSRWPATLSGINDPDPVVVRVGDVDLAGGSDLDPERAVQQRGCR